MLSWFKRKQQPLGWSLDRPLFWWNAHDPFSLRDACTAVAVFGGTGSGKTSTTGRTIATAYLNGGFGMLVLCTKSDERDLWVRYCRETGRTDDLIIFAPENNWRFNPFEYESAQGGRGGGLTPNIVDLIESNLEMANGREKGAGSKGDETYWLNSRKELETNAVDLLFLSGEEISISNISQVIATAPQSMQELASPNWQNTSYCFHRLLIMLHRAKEGELDPRQRRDAVKVAHYFQRQHVLLAEKTRSIIHSTFTSAALILDRGLLRDLFSSSTNISPADVLNGKIVVVDLPVESMGVAGLFSAILWKRSMQLSILRRKITPESRPVCIFADEAQSFITGADASFLSTCRSKLCANVYLTQNINNYIAALGAGEKAVAEVDSILANAGTLIAHANSCPKTGEYFSERIGRVRQLMANFSQSGSAGDWYSALHAEDEQTQTGGFSETLEYAVEPAFYGTLRTGGERNRKLVDAVVYTPGRQFRSTGRNWMTVTLSQA